MVMPETGLEEEPIRPTILDETVTKKNPKTTTSSEATAFPCVGMPGAIDQEHRQQRGTRPGRPTSAGRARCAARDALPPFAEKSFTLSRNDDTIVGMVRASVMRPAARTAPAPVYRM